MVRKERWRRSVKRRNRFLNDSKQALELICSLVQTDEKVQVLMQEYVVLVLPLLFDDIEPKMCKKSKKIYIFVQTKKFEKYNMWFCK